MNNVIDLKENLAWQARKAMLARLLARENIDVHFSPKVDTGMFMLTNRAVVLPIFKAGISHELLDMLIVHEIAHALFTPPHQYTDEIKRLAALHQISENHTSHLLNVLEDVRINRLIVDRYPGSRSDFEIGYRHRFERGDYSSTDINVLNKLPFVDRINIFAKAGHVAPVKFSKAEQALYNEAIKADSWQDVVAVAEKVLKFIVKGIKAKQIGGDDLFSAFMEGDLEALKKALAALKAEGVAVNANVGKLPEEEDKDKEKEEEEPKFNIDTKKNVQTDLNSNEQDISFDKFEDYDQDAFEKAWEEYLEAEEETEEDEANRLLQQEMAGETFFAEKLANSRYLEKNVGSFDYFDVPKANTTFDLGYKDILAKYKHNADKENYVAKWKANAIRNINFMTSVFELKKQANTHSKTTIRKTGLLNPNRLHQYQLVEDIFQKASVAPEGKNHGFIYLLDTSDSMSNNMDQTRRQVAMLAMFARRLQVPYMILTFSQYANQYSKTNSNFPPQNGVVGPCYLTKVFDSDMTNSEFNTMIYRWVSGGKAGYYPGEVASGGTPLNSALLSMYDIAVPFVKKNKVDIFNLVCITDGGATDQVAMSHNSDRINGVVTYNTSVLNDPVTKQKWYSKTNAFYTGDILEMLKARLVATGIYKVNTVNFYLASGYGNVLVKKNSAYDLEMVIDPRILSSSKPNASLSAETYYKELMENQKFYKVFLNSFAETVAMGG